MRSPSLIELPAPPSTRGGWPWTEESAALPETLPNGSPWPRVTVVTPSFNQAEYIEETIRSVLLQGYPNLEYIIMDGGSSDGTVDIVQRYEPWLTYWVSEPDRGQTHAINKGLARATGEIFAYLNSDDLFMPGALATIAEAFSADPAASVLYGRCVYIDSQSNDLFVRQARFSGFLDYLPIWRHFKASTFLTQPEVFAKTEAVRSVGGFREELRAVMDFELWLRLLAHGHSFRPVDASVAKFRFYPEQKSAGAGAREEVVAVVDEYIQRYGTSLTRREKQMLVGEMHLARAGWLVRRGGTGSYLHALSACSTAVRWDFRLLSTRWLWGIVTMPIRAVVRRGTAPVR